VRGALALNNIQKEIKWPEADDHDKFLAVRFTRKMPCLSLYHRLAMRLQIGAGRPEVIKRRFRGDEPAGCVTGPRRRNPAWRRTGDRSKPGALCPPTQSAQRQPRVAGVVRSARRVRTGVAPLPSRVPSIADRTAVDAETVKVPTIAGFADAPGANRISVPVDWVAGTAR
jgi:hypothetical protein